MYSCSGLNSAQLTDNSVFIQVFPVCRYFTELYVNPSKTYLNRPILDYDSVLHNLNTHKAVLRKKRTCFVCPTFQGLPKFHPKTTITFGLVMIFQVFKKNFNSFKVWRTRVLHRIRYLRQRTSFRR